MSKVFSMWNLFAKSNARSTFLAVTNVLNNLSVILSTWRHIVSYSSSMSSASILPSDTRTSSYSLRWSRAIFARTEASSSTPLFIERQVAMGIRNFKVVVTGLLDASGCCFPPRRRTHTSRPPFTSTGQKLSLNDFFSPTVSRKGTQFPIELSSLLGRASNDNIPSLSITVRAHDSVKPAHVNEAPGLNADTSPVAMVVPLTPSMMEYPRSCVPSCIGLIER
mmetsp:Transcript_25512/g.36399  ORF Transcript_25512/g.36399 Transcript_25512/m.36399 type:complete len:222 (-) Transcript_25512:276-941(-)